jgi:hypothetical protein
MMAIHFHVIIAGGHLSMCFDPGVWETLSPEQQATFRRIARELGDGSYAESDCLSEKEREVIARRLAAVMIGRGR